MGPLTAILVLATIQGLTEYLPVSSSGHLVLFRILFGHENGLPEDASLEVWLHLGTLLAVLLFYRQRIVALAGGVLGRGDEVAHQRRLFGMLFLASIPAGLVGTLFESRIEGLFSAPEPAGVALLLTGLVLWASRSLPERFGTLRDLSWKAALVIGIVQALAIAPGISRSGTTIVAGCVLGLGIEAAAAFSFLLSIPAILGAAVLKLPAIFAAEESASIPTLHMALSLLVSFGVGFLALGLLLWLARSQRLSWFAPYCWAAGLAALAFS